MSTSLALQLHKLTVPQTSSLNKDDKKRVSLLFDPKEAANINRDTFYKIGLDGLEELIERSSTFEYFRNNLFYISSKDFERAVQDTKDNEKLNDLIKHFLLCLTPYFMLHCSYKALEWLIYRYHICEYNKKDVLMLILPYHETNIFARTLQLLNLKENDEWRWLHKLKKPGVHLPKLTLFKHAASEPAFIRFIGNNIKMLIEKKINATIYYNFYCVTFTGALEYSDKLTENLITEMVPCTLKGLNSTVLDYCTTSYIILAKLLGKAPLSDKLLLKFIEKITEFPITSIHTEAVMVLVVLFQKQEHLTTFGESIQNIINNTWIVTTLQNLQNSGTNISPFLRAIVKDCIQIGINEDSNEARLMCMELLIKVKYEMEAVTFFIDEILTNYNPKKIYNEDISQWVQIIMKKLETLYPSGYDAHVINIMKNNDGKCTSLRKRLTRFIDKSITVGGHYDLFEKLYHPDFAIRRQTMKLISKQYAKANDREKQFFATSILQHLHENDNEIVTNTLKITSKILPEIVAREKLIPLLFEILDKSVCQDAWLTASVPALEILCAISAENDVKCFVRLLPFILPTRDEDRKFLRTILRTSYGRSNIILKDLANQASTETDCYKLFVSIFDLLKNNLFKFTSLDELLSILDAIEKSSTYRYLTVLIICTVLPKNCTPDFASKLLDILIGYLEVPNLRLAEEESSLMSFIKSSKRNQISLQSVLFCMGNLIVNITEPDAELERLDFSKKTDANKFYLRLMDVLLKGRKNGKYRKAYDDIREKLMLRCVKDIPSRINVYLNMALTENDFINADFPMRCLEVVRDIIVQGEPALNTNDMYIPYLMACTAHATVDIRKISLDSLSACTQTGIYKRLIVEYLSHKEEILMDNEQSPLMMSKVVTKLKNDECCKKLLNILTDTDNPVCFRKYLMKLFSNSIENIVMEGTSLAACKILQTGVNDYHAQESHIIHYNCLKFEQEELAKSLKYNSNTWKFITSALSDFKNVLKDINKTTAQLVLEYVNATFYSFLSNELKKEFLALIVTIGTFATNPELISEMNHFVKKIDLDMSLLVQLLTDMREVQSPKFKVTPIKRRIATIPTPDILDTEKWKKGVTVLEMIQDKKKIRYQSNVLTLLFEILKKCLDFDEQSSVEYPKQLLLSNILHCCSKLNVTQLKENNVDVVLVVQCIRASQNPQTHHHALLVLAQIAAINPKEVLHHIMTIFTFMGSSVLRHDDAYSLQIITRIIDTIIPIITEDCSLNNIINVLRVFVDVILDVPEHRRIPMYKNLLTRMNSGKNLHLFLLLMFEAHVARPDKKTEDELPRRLQICRTLCMEFSPSIVIESCIKLMQYIKKLPVEKPEVAFKDLIFDVANKNPKQFRHYKYTIITFTSTMLSFGEFVASIAELDDDTLIEMESLYKDLIINTLTFIQSTAKIVQKNADTNQSQYWKVMLHLSYDILDSVNALLTPKMFVLVTKGLMAHNLPTVQRRAMELLNAKLQQNEATFEECDETDLFSILPSLMNVVKLIDEEDALDSEQESIVQTALLSLKLLVRTLCPKSPDKFVAILTFLTDHLKKSSGNLLASLLLCIAEMCYYMRAHSIQSLHKYVPAIVKVMKVHKHQETSNLLLLSSLAALSKLLDSLPVFLSPFLEKMLNEFTSLNGKCDAEGDNPKMQPIVAKIAVIKEKIGNCIPLRVLIPNMTKVYDNKIANDCEAIGPLMEILTKSINSVPPSDLQSNLIDLNAFYLNALDFRVAANVAIEEANKIEAQVVDSFISYVLKLSESTFKPIYYKLYDWAVRCEDANKSRIITFYHLSGKMAERLKGLFVNFAGNFVTHAADLLNACNKTKSESLYFDADDASNVLLLEHVLKTLTFVFMYDGQKFINKDRFGVLMQPLVDQLENDLVDVDDLERRAEDAIVPCLVQFAVATGNDALWKQSNYQILLKMRHGNPRIRVIAIRCLTEIAKKLGEDFLPLLPETIPFLAELLEDEDENVEKTCRKAVQELEKTLGEPLQKYF